MTNADHIRAMSDKELMEAIYSNSNWDLGYIIPFCRDRPDNDYDCPCVDEHGEIPDECCKTCLLEWLKQPYTEEDK